MSKTINIHRQSKGTTHVLCLCCVYTRPMSGTFQTSSAEQGTETFAVFVRCACRAAPTMLCANCCVCVGPRCGLCGYHDASPGTYICACGFCSTRDSFAQNVCCVRDRPRSGLCENHDGSRATRTPPSWRGPPLPTYHTHVLLRINKRLLRNSNGITEVNPREAK